MPAQLPFVTRPFLTEATRPFLTTSSPLHRQPLRGARKSRGARFRLARGRMVAALRAKLAH